MFWLSSSIGSHFKYLGDEFKYLCIFTLVTIWSTELQDERESELNYDCYFANIWIYEPGAWGMKVDGREKLQWRSHMGMRGMRAPLIVRPWVCGWPMGWMYSWIQEHRDHHESTQLYQECCMWNCNYINTVVMI
jgi:hypothetical protein